MRRRLFTTWLGHAALCACLALPAAVSSGEWHRDDTLVCSDCHTMHNSSRGQPMRYDNDPANAPLLLRSENATAVCLACHDGHKPAAPNVLGPSNGDPPAGGFPTDLSDPANQAHALGSSAVVPPDGDTPVVMKCTTCHDPHGSALYRNLRPSPSGTGRAAGTPVVVKQAVTATGSNPADVYKASNLVYVSGMSQWCMDCHNLLVAQDWATGQAGIHSWDRSIFSSEIADWTTWSGEVANRIPVQNATGTPAPHAADQVFCLSCHKAHGSPNYVAEIYADGLSFDSTCAQCHDQ
jgi:hypothetical protein